MPSKKQKKASRSWCARRRIANGIHDINYFKLMVKQISNHMERASQGLEPKD